MNLQMFMVPLRVVGAALSKPSATVLNDRLVGRLSTMNRACRALRDMGYRVALHDLQEKRERPYVVIEPHKTQSITPLMDASCKRPIFRQLNGLEHGCVDFMDIDVMWEVKR